jgi:hypothetical protein
VANALSGALAVAEPSVVAEIVVVKPSSEMTVYELSL